MKCAMCNGQLKINTSDIEFNSKVLGVVYVPNIRHRVCVDCGDILIPIEESEKVIDYIEGVEKKVIGQLPISDFVTLNEAAEILDITKQAFSKNPRIKNGFIYSVKMGGRSYYNRKSVEQFKETGDGRYRVPRKEDVNKTDRVVWVQTGLTETHEGSVFDDLGLFESDKSNDTITDGITKMFESKTFKEKERTTH